jgi:hypothetical protein
LKLVISKGYVWSKFLYKGPKRVFKNHENTAKKLVLFKDFEKNFNVRVQSLCFTNVILFATLGHSFDSNVGLKSKW